VDRVVRVGELDRGVEEHAALKVRRVEPLVHDVEEPEQAGARVVAGRLAHRAVPRAGFPLVASADGLDHQLVLALEVLVEGGLGDAGGGDDLVESDGVEPACVEQLDGGGEEPVAPLPGRGGNAEQLERRRRFRRLRLRRRLRRGLAAHGCREL
jgi:hypothetical protein